VGQPSGERLIVRARSITTKAIAVFVGAALLGGCASTQVGSAPLHASRGATAGGRLVAPRTSYAQDTAYFEDLAKVSPSLSSYVTAHQEVALQALLTDGSAFCAFLARGGGVDTAMESVVVGARNVEGETHLPLSVATFNAIDAVALVTLCPKEQTLIPPVDQAHVKALDRSLSGEAG
jgi:hypothetical protein